MLDVLEAGRDGGAGISCCCVGWVPAWDMGRVGVGGARYCWYCEVRDWREVLVLGRGTEGLVPLSDGSGREALPEMVLPVLRFLLRTVTEEGMVVVSERGVGVGVGVATMLA